MTNLEKLYDYFRLKTNEITILAEQVLASHKGLIGTYREDIITLFLKNFLPKKYAIGSGQFMSLEFQRDYESSQSDVIIWDSYDYPKIPQHGQNSLFFAESIKMVLEVKSHFNSHELTDIQRKTVQIKSFIPDFHWNIRDEIWRLDNKIARAANGKADMTTMASAPLIAVAAFCYKGGEEFSIQNINVVEIEDSFPDVMILLSAGKLIVKEYEIDEKNRVFGFLRNYQTDKNSLIGFTAIVTSLLADRDTQTNSPFQFGNYVKEVFDGRQTESIAFVVTRPLGGVEILS